MAEKLTPKRKTGLALFVAGLVLTLACHLLGSWELTRYGGNWGSIHSEKLGYDIAFYDAHPTKTEVGQVTIYGGFASGAQIYFPFALSLLRSGYAVRLVSHSGFPNSPVEMSYKSHPVESSEAARDFIAAQANVPLFLIGHSEGTRYALLTGREISSVKGVVVTSPTSASMDPRSPANVLILVAEDDFDMVKRQAQNLLMNGTNLARPKFNELYGSLEHDTGRMAGIMPGTNHFNILLKGETQRKALDWINRISNNRAAPVSLISAVKFPVLGICAVLGAAVSAIGIGLLFPGYEASRGHKGIWALVLLVALVVGWGLGPVIANYIPITQKIPLLVYGRVLIFFVVATVPLAILAIIRPKLGAGIPRGSWTARAALLGLTVTLLLFNRWLIGVLPTGQRLLWFGLAALISGGYFAFDEFLRRGVQRATDWQTGFALGLAGSFIAALSVAGAGFFLWSPLGQFVIGGAITLFALTAGCEIFATYLFTTTNDWLLSWWVRVAVCNGFLAGLVPLVNETAFRNMIP